MFRREFLWPRWLLLVLVLGAMGGLAMPMEEPRITPLTRPWEVPIPLQKNPVGLPNLRAETCGQCHDQIYREWRASTHARALEDPQFQVEWKKDEHSFVCRNCHIPLANQQQPLVTGLFEDDFRRPVTEENPSFDDKLMREGITCAVCHVRDGFVIGPYGDTHAPHATRRDPDLLSSELCVKCHEQEGRLTKTLVCSFTTGQEWKASPYPERGRTCVTCHMAEVYRPLVPGFTVRESNRHNLPGGGIGKVLGTEDKVRQNFKSGLRLTVEQAWEKETVRFTVGIANEAAGHDVPTGDVERFVVLTFQLVAASGEVLQERTERIGEVWEWWPEAKKVGDNSLAPLERRLFRVDYPLSDDLAAASFRVLVTNHRMQEHIAEEQGLVGKYPISVEVLRREIPLQLDLPPLP